MDPDRASGETAAASHVRGMEFISGTVSENNKLLLNYCIVDERHELGPDGSCVNSNAFR